MFKFLFVISLGWFLAYAASQSIIKTAQIVSPEQRETMKELR